MRVIKTSDSVNMSRLTCSFGFQPFDLGRSTAGRRAEEACKRSDQSRTSVGSSSQDRPGRQDLWQNLNTLKVTPSWWCWSSKFRPGVRSVRSSSDSHQFSIGCGTASYKGVHRSMYRLACALFHVGSDFFWHYLAALVPSYEKSVLCWWKK